MKKYLELATGVMAVVGALSMTPAYAAGGSTACDGATPSSSITGATDTFIQVTFVARCSANVFLSYSQDATLLAVGSASRKGKNIFFGHTNGGGVSVDAACTASPCTATEADTAAGTAFTNGSST